ncbi:3-deoxy-D-manno-octulosonic acid transferase [Pseudogemmobacter sonorensis]|uniref:3-deoxy-D-manno-octulosonic acid transferase n=1 Tax=Pseudogemmobacter sonorensis TaxID=2989681 RepID=UPI0036B68E29
MVASLGRTLYNFGQRHLPGAETARPPRPAGALVWLHVPGPGAAPGMLELARRLSDEDGATVLMTCPEPLPTPSPGVILQPPPAETAGAAAAFLDHWRPAALVFCEGELRPAAVLEAARRGLPLMMVDARAPHLPKGREGWFPGLMRSALSAFSRVVAIDETAARAFRKAGAPSGAVLVAGRMEAPSAALPCLEAEREALARLTAARPIWFAVSIPEAEEQAVLSTHRAVIGLAHRLLLILLPEDPARAEPLAAALEAEGWSVTLRSADQEPEAETEIYVVGDRAELGLWYRLAPITFLGGSLAGTGALQSPLEPAALGSAILHGPRPGAFGAALGRLGAARAARAVATPADLAEALGDLLSPDRAARLAQAAWNVASDGAEVTEMVLAHIRRVLEEAG